MNKNKTITIIIALIIVLGIIITLTAGFNVELLSRKHQQVLLNLGKEFNTEDVKNITNEVFDGQAVEIEKVDTLESRMLISAEEITEEQKASLVTKINEKYSTELKSEDVTINTIPKAKLMDYLMPHVWEFVWVTVIVLAYYSIRFRKLNILKVFAKTVLGVIIGEALVFSIIAIVRAQVGANIVAVAITMYVATILVLTSMFEKQLQQNKNEEGTKK